MTKAVFTSKIEPSYDDLPEERYHFPQTYLRQVEAALGDWIVYYEPRRATANFSSCGGRQAYFATARVQKIDVDSKLEGHFYAYTSDYLEFDRAVPFKEGKHYYESGLRRSDGATSKGAFGRMQAAHEGTPHQPMPDFGVEEESRVFERPIIEMVVTRPFREAAFATSVKAAYSNTCAMTGLKIINGGGRAEVQAAHIRPVAEGGSDSIRNGLALSGTIHWMFDRGLVSVDDDLSILVARTRLPETIIRLLREDRKMFVPERLETRPHPIHLRYHRDHIFKG